MPQPCIVVIGAGVVGLSCAVRLQTILPDHDILLVAREWPSPADAPSPDYASMWAGAHVRPIPGDTPQLRREAAWLKATAGEFGRLVREEPAAGVTRTEGLEYFEAPPAEYRALDAASFEASSGLEGYRVLPRAELPADGVQFGFAYSTYCVNPHIYCLGLLRKFVAAGGKTLRHHLRSQWEAYSLHVDVGLVINASGIGFNDARCYPTRGQIALTNSNATKTVTRQNRDGTWSYVIPRSFRGGTIVGGTKEANDWRTDADPATRKRILDGAASILPHAKEPTAEDRELRVIADIVGRRPTRLGGPRVEFVEENSPGPNGAARRSCFIHAYGVGGRGYELSWGIADEVSQLAHQAVSNLDLGAGRRQKL